MKSRLKAGEMCQRLDIAFVITGLSIGGAEIQVTGLAIEHARRGRRVGVISLVSNGTTLKERLSANGIPLVELGMPRGRPTLDGALLAIRTLRRWKPRIVHGHMFHANLLARFARPFVTPDLVVCSAHNSNEGGRFRMSLYRITHGFCDVLTNVSSTAACELESRGAAPRGSIRTAWNGIDTVRFVPRPEQRSTVRAELGVSESQYVFLTVGRLVPQKDHRTLLKSLAIVLQHCPGVMLVVAGDGELKDALKSLCQEIGVADHVLWLGVRTDVDRLMNAADCFVLSSTFEGFGMAVAEAMASGVPVISTRSFGPEEVLGGLGRVVPAGDSGRLAAAMLEQISEEAEQLGRRIELARKRAIEKFSMAAAIAAWDQLYSEFGVELTGKSAG